MNDGRRAIGAVVFKDCLVVAGGAKTDGELLIKEEKYISTFNKWQQISKLNQGRVFNELVSCNSCLFALGGNEMEQLLSSMEKLSNLDGVWGVVESMNEPRAWFATTVNFREEIYAIGGLTITTIHQTMKMLTMMIRKRIKKLMIAMMKETAVITRSMMKIEEEKNCHYCLRHLHQSS